jgi:hypothetical protein
MHKNVAKKACIGCIGGVAKKGKKKASIITTSQAILCETYQFI